MRIYLANGAINSLAAALVAFSANNEVNDFVSRKLLTAVAVAKANNPAFDKAEALSLPSDFTGAHGIIIALNALTGTPVVTDGRALPEAAITRAQQANAKFTERMANKPARKTNATSTMRPRIGKTAKTGGRTAALARKRAKAEADRILRAQMRGGNNSKNAK